MTVDDTEGRGVSNRGVDTRRVWSFIALAFGISWTVAAAIYVSGTSLNGVRGVVLLTAGYMWAPAVSAIVIQRLDGSSVREGCGLFRGRLRWSVLAWLVPVPLLVATIGVGLLVPGTEFTTDYGAFLRGMGLSQEQIEASLAALEGVPAPPFVVFVGQGLVAGLTVNAVAALGEEMGWRGLLLTELSPLGFWRASLLTGLVWGVWHAPIILQGHNFPEAPVAGVAVMTLWTVAASPVFTYVALRARSVLAPTLLHGTFNAVGFLSLVYLTGAGRLLVSPVGVAGIGAAVLATATCVAHDRYLATNSVTTGEALTPWS